MLLRRLPLQLLKLRPISTQLPSKLPIVTRSYTIMTTERKITDWVPKDSKTGEFNRLASTFRHQISRTSSDLPPESNRYHLYVSYACPWAHRTLIVRALKGLEKHISVSVVHWHMGPSGWRFGEEGEGEEIQKAPEPNTGAKFMRDIYNTVEGYDGRFTVPLLWDKKMNRIVNNESSEIIRMFYEEFDDILPEEKRGNSYYKEEDRQRIDEFNGWVYETVNNGVYKSGFATTQEAYEKAVISLFSSLDKIEAILRESSGPYIFGSSLTEADIRLYPTIIRFDPVYVQHFKTNLKMIRHDYPNIEKWLRHLYWDIPAFRETTNFEHIKKHYTKSHPQINPHGITPLGPVPDILPKNA
ncbi:Similar to Glutathione S-transferase omega-like 2; acc. no. O94524 [Pyronema omphalodes CBS 100304]|uniref:Glutathione S-transferase omega-like 2 n=1 Tax=Pyronema omphalodes (strain CBS 100304) TaxID=1076935 RepID=U4L027_PYROM|nr:Similar to Glutathione S-transferase omega-like 2; acc. no. O94524 [Pyronema omphalodes CBS 100304]